MEHHKEIIKSGCHKILEGINSMSLENLDDQQVHSLVMMREIARGVVDGRDRKVTKNDMINALRCNIEKMVCASRDIIHILSRMSYAGLDDQRMHLVLRMQEIAHGVVDKQPRVAITRPGLLADEVCFVDEGTKDSPVVEPTKISNGDALIHEFGEKRYNNEGAYAILKSPDFASPSFSSFKSADRPMVYPYLDFDADDVDSTKADSSQVDIEASTSFVSCTQDAARPEFDFESLGIYKAPSWSVQLPDGSSGTQVVQVPRAPLVEGLPLPPNIQEPHKGAYEYLFKLVAGLKHMIATRETENSARISALRRRARKRKSRDHI